MTDLPFAVTSYVPNPHFDVVCRINSSTLDNQEVELDNSTKAVIYPNPAKEFFTVENKENIDNLKVFDVSGKLIYQINDSSQSKIRINSGSWPKGTYMVQIRSGDRVQLMKVLVQ